MNGEARGNINERVETKREQNVAEGREIVHEESSGMKDISPG